MNPVTINNRAIGPGHPAYLIAEIGINHNGILEVARKLMAGAWWSGFDAVKFQKRTVDIVYSAEELAKPRKSQFGETNGDLKRGLEFGQFEYEAIARQAESYPPMHWFASPWDCHSVEFLKGFDIPAFKIASASVTDGPLLAAIKATGKPIIMSTAFSELEEIDRAVEIVGTDNLLIMHCHGSYPAPNEELNLSCIRTLIERYGVPVGYSHHGEGIDACKESIGFGACAIEVHVTLDKKMQGSDHKASLGKKEVAEFMEEIRGAEARVGNGKKIVWPSELPTKDKLRKPAKQEASP